MFTHVDIDLGKDLETIRSADYSKHTLSAIHSNIVNPEYDYAPSLCKENTTIQQLWWEKELDLAAVGKQLGMFVITASSILLPPGNVIPWHTDTFVKMKGLHPERNDFVRAMIYVTEYEPGQVTQIRNGTGLETYTNWKPGSGYLIDDTVPHVNINGSNEPVITINYSGFILDK
mgnify:CR=1 FL=1|tara:strand:- start:572 stop:1093 length:522 start_codon:yes stop_codon:yes gene_type:complete